MIVLSVVVATYNRRETLRVTLQKLAAQTYPASDFEVLVVDDGSSDNTGEMVLSLVPEMPYSLRYLYHANKGPGATENRGIREALGEFILLIADDIHPTPGMLESHMRYHREHPEPHLASLGSAFQSPDLPQTVFQRKWDPFRYRQLAGTVELPYWKFWACNISLKRSFLLENGLFQERKGAAHEDVELGYRLCRKGLRIFYNPDALAYHYHIETLKSASARAYERGLNWEFIEENVPDPQIHVKYHILNFHTLKYHVQTFSNLSASCLPKEDRILPWLVLRQMIRWVAFNRMTVPLWERILNAADHNRFLAALMHPYMYRGAVFYYFIKGCHDKRSSRSRSSSLISTQPGEIRQ